MGSSAEERTNDIEDIKIKTSQTEIRETNKQTNNNKMATQDKMGER